MNKKNYLQILENLLFKNKWKNNCRWIFNKKLEQIMKCVPMCIYYKI